MLIKNRFALVVRPLLLAAGATLLLVGCGEQPTTASPPTQADTPASPLASQPAVLTVNGMEVPQAVIDAYRQQRGSMQHGDDNETVLDEIIDMILVYQQALRQGVDREVQVAAELENHRINHVALTSFQREIGAHEPDESLLRSRYEETIKDHESTEYKARHILVQSEEEAAGLIVELDAGGDFAALAQEHSTGPTGPNGGDLGWFSADNMVEPFANAVRAMEIGSHSSEPVQTQFGWHVILLEDSREGEPASFEQMRPQLSQAVTQEYVQSYLEGLREGANIQRH